MMDRAVSATFILVGAVIGYFAGQLTGGETALLGAITAALVLGALK
jgi:hypothetical protein